MPPNNKATFGFCVLCVCLAFFSHFDQLWIDFHENLLPKCYFPKFNGKTYVFITILNCYLKL